jgi:hypothetical protein
MCYQRPEQGTALHIESMKGDGTQSDRGDDVKGIETTLSAPSRTALFAAAWRSPKTRFELSS